MVARPHCLSRRSLARVVRRIQREQVAILRGRIRSWINAPNLPLVFGRMLRSAYGQAPAYVADAWRGDCFSDPDFISLLAQVGRVRRGRVPGEAAAVPGQYRNGW